MGRGTYESNHPLPERRSLGLTSKHVSPPHAGHCRSQKRLLKSSKAAREWYAEADWLLGASRPRQEAQWSSKTAQLHMLILATSARMHRDESCCSDGYEQLISAVRDQVSCAGRHI